MREPVPTYFGANQFTIDSEFGAFEANGNEMLVRRINEINAIARLKEISRTDEYKKALTAPAKSPVAAMKNIANDPVNTVSNVPKGIMKFMRRAGESVKNIGKKSESSAAEGSKMQQMIGFSDAKRKVAAKLGVDPYSTNSVLQRELEGIAWASFAGGLTFQVATMPIGGPALTVTGVTSTGAADSSARLYVSSRVWTPEPGTTGTTSQSLPAIPTSSINTQIGLLLAVGGADKPENYRVNVGIVNVDPTRTQTFVVSLPTSSGNAAVYAVTVPPMSMQQVALGSGISPTQEVLVQNATSSATLSNSWIAYGSTIDNVTGDAWSELAVLGTTSP